MNYPYKKWVVCCAAVALAGAAAFAQQQQDPQSSQSSQSSQGGASAQQSQSGQQAPWQKAQSEEFFRASKLIGKNAQTANGQKVGEIKEIVFNQQGEIFGLLDVGNGKWAAVPWQVFNAATAKGNQNVVVNTTQQALNSAPSVSQDQWGAINNPDFTKGIYAYYHIQPPATGGASSPGGGGSGKSQ